MYSNVFKYCCSQSCSLLLQMCGAVRIALCGPMIQELGPYAVKREVKRGMILGGGTNKLKLQTRRAAGP